MTYHFLFGTPVAPCHAAASGVRRLFVIGAYPSALHVQWRAPGWKRPIQAVAVDNEPEPFWTGTDEVVRIRAWMATVALPASVGQFTPCGRLNGSSGSWVEDRILRPLRTKRTDAWITDCLDTYRQSKPALRALEARSVKAVLRKHAIAAPQHQEHPSEDAIVAEALEQHQRRIQAELEEARPELVVSLGNAALRVLRDLVDHAAPSRLSCGPEYGERRSIRFGGLPAEWIPLAHPAAPGRYQRAHYVWIGRQPQASE